MVVMSEVLIRRGAMPSDRHSVESITRSSGFFTEVEVQVALEVFDDAIKSPEHAGYNFLFATKGEQTVGYACWGLNEQTQSTYELYWIVVDDAARSSGIGKKLLLDVESAIAEIGHGQLFVETAGRDQYTPTREFYERQGYTQKAWFEDYFAPGDAMVIFAKRI
jgi:GNAT superfamily N-acetyltransferase